MENPGCAVYHVHEDDMLSPLVDSSGVFMLGLKKEFAARGLEVPFVGFRESNPMMLAEDTAWIRNRVIHGGQRTSVSSFHLTR